MKALVSPERISGLLAVSFSRAEPVIKGIRSHPTAVAGTVVLVVVALVALPGFVSALVDIASEHT